MSSEQVTFSVATFPAIEACPDCGCRRLVGAELVHEEVSLSLDGEGGISHYEEDTLYETYFTSLECAECGVAIIEDGEIVHEGAE